MENKPGPTTTLAILLGVILGLGAVLLFDLDALETQRVIVPLVPLLVNCIVWEESGKSHNVNAPLFQVLDILLKIKNFLLIDIKK